MISSDPDHTALLGQARKLQAMLESAVDAIITIDGAGIITTVNPAAARLFGYPEAEFLGRNVHFLMPEPYHSAHDGYIANYRSASTCTMRSVVKQNRPLRRKSVSLSLQFPL